MNASEQEEITTISTVPSKQIVRSTVKASTPTEEEHFSEKKTIFRFYQTVWYILGILEILLTFRFVLKLIGANPFNGFSSFVYALSDPFVNPFFGIVSVNARSGNVIEWPTLIGMAVYVVIAYILVEFLQLVKPVSKEEVQAAVDEL